VGGHKGQLWLNATCLYFSRIIVILTERGAERNKLHWGLGQLQRREIRRGFIENRAGPTAQAFRARMRMVGHKGEDKTFGFLWCSAPADHPKFINHKATMPAFWIWRLRFKTGFGAKSKRRLDLLGHLLLEIVRGGGVFGPKGTHTPAGNRTGGRRRIYKPATGGGPVWAFMGRQGLGHRFRNWTSALGFWFVLALPACGTTRTRKKRKNRCAVERGPCDVVSGPFSRSHNDWFGGLFHAYN